MLRNMRNHWWKGRALRKNWEDRFLPWPLQQHPSGWLGSSSLHLLGPSLLLSEMNPRAGLFLDLLSSTTVFHLTSRIKGAIPPTYRNYHPIEKQEEKKKRPSAKELMPKLKAETEKQSASRRKKPWMWQGLYLEHKCQRSLCQDPGSTNMVPNMQGKLTWQDDPNRIRRRKYGKERPRRRWLW